MAAFIFGLYFDYPCKSAFALASFMSSRGPVEFADATTAQGSRHMSMEAMMREFARMSGENESKPPALIVEALRDQAQFFARQNPFSVGDIVTPRKGATIKGAGDPHIVIAVNESAAHDFGPEPGSTAYGRKPDLRVLCWHNGDWPPYWVESSLFEPWVEKAAETEAAAAEAA